MPSWSPKIGRQGEQEGPEQREADAGRHDGDHVAHPHASVGVVEEPRQHRPIILGSGPAPQPRRPAADPVASGPVTVTLPDGNRLELPDGATGHDAAAAIGPGLAKAAVAVRVGDEIRDLALPLGDGDEIQIVTPKSGDDYLYVMRHSAAHVMAEAVQTLIPGTKLGFGPPIEDGFYYDFDAPRPITEDDFPAIEAEMSRIIASKAPFQRSVMSVDDARAFFAEREDPYKVDQIDLLASQGEIDGVAVPRPRVRRPLPRPARPGHRADRPGQADVGGGRLLARQREEPAAHPPVRDGVHPEEGPGGAPRAARAGPRPRPPAPRPRPRALPLRRARARLPVLPAPRDGRGQRHQGGRPRRAREHGLRGDPDARRCSTPSSGRPRATGTTTARTCTSRRSRGRASRSSR